MGRQIPKSGKRGSRAPLKKRGGSAALRQTGGHRTSLHERAALKGSPGTGTQSTQGAAARESTDRRAARKALAPGGVLWGFHPVREALRSEQRAITSLYATAPAADRLSAEIAARQVTAEILEAAEISKMLPAGAVHQGLVALVQPLPRLDITDLPLQGLVLVLDQITDPHNLGAIIRSAAAFAVDAIVLTERNAPELAGIVAKSASGGLEHVPVIPVVNLARAMRHIGELGYWRVGLDSDGPADIHQTRLERPLALVLGAEGKGLRRLTREHCDAIVRLDVPGAIKSLNVSNACAVALSFAAGG